MFRRRLLVTDGLLVFELFRAHIIILITTSPKRVVTVLIPFLEKFENSALTPIQLLLQLVFESSSKIFDVLLTGVPAAKDEA